VNTPIIRLFTLVVVLFGLLVAFTSRWTVFEAQALRENPNNRRSLLAEQQLRRGTIRSSDGTVIARSVRGADKVYDRRYPTGALFGHPIGYSFAAIASRSGYEQSENEVLTGASEELVTTFESLIGRRQEGNDVVTTLDSRAQRVATGALQGRRGAVVALDAKTGASRRWPRRRASTRTGSTPRGRSVASSRRDRTARWSTGRRSTPSRPAPRSRS
jgi:peptidoglycan glycosyltransferase